MKMLKLREKLLSSTNVLGVIAAASIMSMASNVYAESAASYNPSVYLGVDGVYSFMKFKGNNGGNMFAKSAPGVNVFVGGMFNDMFGVEAGFEIEKKEKRDVTLKGGSIIAGWDTSKNANALVAAIHSEVKQRHPYVGVIANANINDKCFATALLGVSVSHVNAKYNLVDAHYSINETATFSKTKPVAMARLSVGYKLTDNFAVRAYTTWRNTSRFKITAKENTPGNLIKLRDSFNVGLGVAYNIV